MTHRPIPCSAGSPTSSQIDTNFGLQRLKTGPAFLLTLRKFCILRHSISLPGFADGDQQTNSSTKLCHTADSKSRQQHAVEKSGSLPKTGGQKTLHLFGFPTFLTTSRFNGQYSLNEENTDIQARALESTHGSQTSSLPPPLR